MKIIPIYFLIVHITSGFAVGDGEFCPNFCQCGMWYRLRHASCTSQHLYNVDTGVSDIVEALDLSDNAISLLENFELANVGLANLKYLNLSDNSISEIRLHAFDRLVKLAVLDLSRNHLYYLLQDTFLFSPNLRVLHLSGNHFNSHSPILRSNSLTDLNLSLCRIGYLPQDTFKRLPQIRYLDLSNNFMIQLNIQVLRPLLILRRLSIEGNPWTCNEDMSDLQKYLQSRNVVFSSPCKDASQPKMFEKMISLVSTKPNNDRSSKSGSITNWVTKSPSIAQATANVTTKKHDVDGTDIISPVFLFSMGFVLGSAISMVGTYIWISGIMSHPLRQIRTRDGTSPSDNTSQRVSLLENSNGDVAVCPGTPPPSYHEIMLNRTLYPSAPNAILLNSSRENQ